MGSGHPLQDSDATLPPLSALKGKVCPRCHRQLEISEPGYELEGPASGPAALPRCPEHGLAYVDGGDLAAAHGDIMLGTTVTGRFTILARLGSGSMGAVYRARQEAVGRDVAIKIVRRDRAYDPETKARFEREARATSALVSPHTVTVFDFGEAEDGAWFLAMELLDGETLGQRLRRTRRLPVPDAVRVAREALKSLAEAHAKGIVHRDLKPDNLFLVTMPDEAGNPATQTCKVLDFGIAKVLSDEQKVDQLETQAGTVFGTPRYMSPEQAQGTTLDARSDLYSLGVILFQMLAGRAPFVDDDAVVVMARHIKEEPPAMREVAPQAMVPPLLERVVRRALSKQPGDRPQSAEQFIYELDAAMENSGAVVTGVHATSWAGPGVPSSSRRRKALALGAGALGLGLVFASGYLAFRLFRSPSVAHAAASAAPPTASIPVVALAPEPGAPSPTDEAGAREAADAGGDANSATVEKTHRHSTKRPIPRRAAPAHRRAPAAVDLDRKAGDKYGRFE